MVATAKQNDTDAETQITLASLANAPRWVAWETRLRAPTDKVPTKIPFDPRTGHLAKANDHRTWGTRAQAEARAATLPKPFGLGGIGIELGIIPGEDYGIAGFDADSCIAPDGTVAPWAEALESHVASYSETSPSRTGFKGLFLYSADDLPAIQAVMGTKTGKQWKQPGEGAHPPGIELYVQGRYFAVTAQIRPGAPEELRHLTAAEILHIITTMGPAIAGTQGPQDGTETSAAPDGRGTDKSRSAAAFRAAARCYREGMTYEQMVSTLSAAIATASWCREQGLTQNQRGLKRIWAKIEATARTEPAPKWLDQCQTNRMGEPRSNLHNVLIAMRSDPRVAGLLHFDEMAIKVTITKPVPGKTKRNFNDPRPIEDADELALLEFMQHSGLETTTAGTLRDAILLVAKEKPVHPVQDYLNSIQWDGTHRLHLWLHKYLGVENTEYASRVGIMFLISMVARVFEPGCKVDTMLILEGDQGLQKSKACEVLAGTWFGDSLPPLERTGNHDIGQYIVGKWLIEVSELASMDKADVSRLKQFLSLRVQDYRPSYGHNYIRQPRQCVFIGTTNKREYLRDETGARRYWPVFCHQIDIESLVADRDQLFAEALAAYRSGEKWWVSENESASDFKQAQEMRREADAWEERIAGFISTQSKVTVFDVAKGCLNIETEKLGTSHQRRIAAALAVLGWERGPRGNKGERYFYPKSYLDTIGWKP